jgi:hypothetical protein
LAENLPVAPVSFAVFAAIRDLAISAIRVASLAEERMAFASPSKGARFLASGPLGDQIPSFRHPEPVTLFWLSPGITE